MAEREGVFDRIRARGGEVLAQVSGELMSNPHFMKALEGALRGKAQLDQAVGRALKTLNVPTRGELKKIVARLEALEADVAGLKARAHGTPQGGKTAKPRRRPAARRRPKAAPPTESAAERPAEPPE